MRVILPYIRNTFPCGATGISQPRLQRLGRVWEFLSPFIQLFAADHVHILHFAMLLQIVKSDNDYSHKSNGFLRVCFHSGYLRSQ